MNGFYWIYLILCGLALMYTFTTKQNHRKQVFYGACGLLILLFVVQESTVSPDMENYVNGFYRIKGLSWAELGILGWEMGFVILNKVIGLLFQQPRTLLLFLSLFILCPIFRWIKKDSAMPMISLVSFVALGFLGTAMGIFRQWCAMAILTASYKFVQKRMIVPFGLTVLLAFFFHRTAAVFAVIYFIYGLRIDKKLLFWSIAVTACLAILGRPLLSVLNMFARIPAADSFNGGITLFLVLWFFVLLSYWLLNERLEEPRIKLLFVMLLSGAVLQSISFTFSLWSRVVWFFIISLVLLIPELYMVVCRQLKDNKILTIVHKYVPKAYDIICSVYNTKAFVLITHVMLMAVLFAWLTMTVGSVYTMAPL